MESKEPDGLVSQKGMNSSHSCERLLNQVQGENVSKKDPIRKSYYRTYKTADEFEDDSETSTVSLLQCDEAEPPSRKTSNVKPLCTIEFQVDTPFWKLQDYTNPNGEVLKRLNYAVEMIPSGATLDFEVSINGKRQGTQNVSVSFQ